ncbi:hypothetical protein STEG23_009026, partial [Scotinomys teguina]
MVWTIQLLVLGYPGSIVSMAQSKVYHGASRAVPGKYGCFLLLKDFTTHRTAEGLLQPMIVSTMLENEHTEGLT